MGPSLLEPLIDLVAAEFLDRDGEVRVVDVELEVAQRAMALPDVERMRAIVEAFMGAVGARLGRRTMAGRDLCNTSTEDELLVQRWSPEAERLALERRGKRKPGRPLDA